MLKSITSAAFITLITSTGAFALPAASSNAALQATNSTLVQQAQYHGHYHKPRPHVRPHVQPRRYAPGARLRTAPRGWHRYKARPSNWHTRGCVVVGPVWFCP